MRVFTWFAVVAMMAAAAGVPTARQRSQGSPDPATVLAAAREALGGEKRLSAVKTFVATGRTRQVRGENLVPIEFEIACELPDKYVRKDEIPAQESGPSATGFNGNELIQDPPQAAPPMPPRAGAPPPTAAQLDAMRMGRVNGVKQDFVRLTLGMFATSWPSYPLTFSYVGIAEAPQGKADVLDVKGPGNFTLRFFINTGTHLPVMVSWQAPAGPQRGGRGPGGPPGAPRPAAPPAPSPPSPPPAGATPAPSPTPPPENRLYYGDYRDVDGMQFPFRIRRAVGPDTTEETTFDRFRINARIDPKKFEVRK